MKKVLPIYFNLNRKYLALFTLKKPSRSVNSIHTFFESIIMEVKNTSSAITTITSKEEGDDVPLPGFRFHPTDEELVGFYLRRKVEKRPISIELIKQADIYKYDPWDLPKSSKAGEKEWFFYCKRGRKYKNSVRPNRVTGSGFWKATGIDRPIYSSNSSGGRNNCIGLKKSLVYYRGSAGKGTKTEWMMHEFRLPTNHDSNTTKHMDAKTIAQEAEVWTLCRILKRNVSYKKCTVPDWREVAAKRSIVNPVAVDASSETCSIESSEYQNNQSSYISFNAPMIITQNIERKPYSVSGHIESSIPNYQHHHQPGHLSSSPISQAPSVVSSTLIDINELLRNTDWEDLRSIVDYTAATPTNPF
ncbi:hypothetical protein BUALT_Bualt03G0166700 [Buddleja alternifolia]|uniref:NAC domain-containing protein n=1 Tax=Buddleja alternifolia TaxID=168488 RepID=A0AAV6XW30_9LAMI|nr:hypothetical protein BUALT_Bualt03G0166700 [Buddleja alternifolia]